MQSTPTCQTLPEESRVLELRHYTLEVFATMVIGDRESLPYKSSWMENERKAITTLLIDP